jgi:hypothetical protein
MGIFPLSAAVVSAVFSALLLRQFAARRKPHQLAWALAMAAFAAASLSVSIGVMAGWSRGWYRSYYLFGAIANVPILAVGTLYLFSPRRVGPVAAVAVAGALIYAVVAVVSAHLPSSLVGMRGVIPAGAKVMAPSIRTLSRYYSYTAFLIVVLGAGWSSLKLARRRETRLRRLAQGNALIALGTAVVAGGSAFARYGHGEYFAVALACGVCVMFAGFLRTRSEPAKAPVNELSPDSLSGRAAG